MKSLIGVPQKFLHIPGFYFFAISVLNDPVPPSDQPHDHRRVINEMARKLEPQYYRSSKSASPGF
jgi:hypothetical protein